MGSLTTHAQIPKIVRGLVLTTASLQKRKAIPSTLCLVPPMVRPHFFLPLLGIVADPALPPVVWCWGWDGAGDLDGPDVDPIWEEMPEKSKSPHAVEVKHDRRFKGH